MLIVQKLDIEPNLAKQNLNMTRYDVIIVNNMLPAISNIDTTLQNAKKSLKPAGKLIIMTLSKLTSRAAGLLGLIDQRWLQNFGSTRRAHYIPEASWATIITDNGVLPPEVFIQDSQHANVQQMSLTDQLCQRNQSKVHSRWCFLRPCRCCHLLLIWPATSPRISHFKASTSRESGNVILSNNMLEIDPFIRS